MIKITKFYRNLGLSTLYFSIVACAPSDFGATNQAQPKKQAISSKAEIFFKNTMNQAPFLPNNTNTALDIKLAETNAGNKSIYLNSTEANYAEYGWEQRINHNWSFFNIPATDGKVLIIDIKQKNAKPAYRYFANANTQNDLYEPWSSSKIFAYTGAIAKLRKNYPKVLLDNEQISQFGEHHLADLITSVNSYETFGLADGNSNAIATFFANIATRDLLSALFYDSWLKLSTPHIFFRGAYGPEAFAPNEYQFTTQKTKLNQEFTIVSEASDDSGYLPYRCKSCGLTGNKPMTTLAQAEWLKRLAMHSLDPVFAHPYLQQTDIDTLFYGVGHSKNDNSFAGMTLGISTMLQKAIARNLLVKNQNKILNAHYTSDDILHSAISTEDAKQILDEYSAGKWRVFQKIGWGPSETRSTSENVVLAYVYLPSANPDIPNKAFVIAAQTAVPEAKEENVALAGLKMEALLSNAMSKYLRIY